MELDQNIMIFIQENLRNDLVTPFLIFITHLGDHGAIWIMIALILTLIKKTRKLGIVVAVSLVLCAGVGEIIKYTVCRPRPFLEIEGLKILVEAPTSYSFPSLHTTCGFSVSYIIFWAVKGIKRYPFIILATLMAFSRVYVGVHYLSDVLAGFIIATVASLLVYKRCSKILE